MTRSNAARAAGLLLTAAVALWLPACAARTSRTYDDLGVDGPERSISTTLLASGTQARLENGRQALSEGRFLAALQLLQSVYDEASARPEWRAQALLDLGRTHAAFLNPRRDLARARELFERFLEEFPGSELRPEAQRQLELLNQPR